MKDSIILGSGNSRYLKSVQNFKTLYPTYDDFAAALVAGTLPIDLNGINAAGFQQVGDALGKATLLKDNTAALLGLGSDAVPDAAFNMLGTSLKNTRRWELYSSYTYESNSIIELYLDAPAADMLNHEFIVEILTEKSFNKPFYHYGYYGDICLITDEFTSNRPEYGYTISKFDNKGWSYSDSSSTSTSYSGPKILASNISSIERSGSKILFHIYVGKEWFTATTISGKGIIYRVHFSEFNEGDKILPTLKQVMLSYRNDYDHNTGFPAGTKVNIYRLTEGGV